MLHHPRRQETADDPQQALVADAPRQATHHHIVVDPVEGRGDRLPITGIFPIQ
jgi:hypothetical protein